MVLELKLLLVKIDDFAKNLVSIKGVVAFDVAVRHAQSFVAILDVTT